MINKLFTRFGISKLLFNNVGIIFFANLGNNGVAFLINIAIAKWFSYESFGQFSVAINIAVTVQGVAELGMNLTMLRLYTSYKEDVIKRMSVLAWNISFKLLLIIIISVYAWLFLSHITALILPGSNKERLIYYAIVSGLFLLLWEFFKTLYQCSNNFRYIAFCTIVYSILRILSICFFYVKGIGNDIGIDIGNIFISVYALPLLPLLGFGFFHLQSQYQLGRTCLIHFAEIENEFLSYSKWVAMGGVSFILMQSTMIFMVAKYTDLKSVSLLTAGLTFTAIFNLFNASITQVVLPRAAAINGDDIPKYKSRLIKLFPVIVLLGFLAICCFSGVMYFMLGEAYKESLPIFWISSVGSILTTWLGLYSLVLHSIKRPDIIGVVSLLSLITFVIGGYFILNFLSYKIFFIVAFYAFIIVLSEIAKYLFIERVLAK